ncbi:MAG: autotransporter domain-containing protein [Hyphomicrobiales bacterium]|nr:autotransporter domain-containing protein [Hyphomicrobiales bacterium]
MKTIARPAQSALPVKLQPGLFITTSIAALLLAVPSQAGNITVNNMSVGPQTNPQGASITTILILNNATVTGAVINSGTISQSTTTGAPIGINVDQSTVTQGINNNGSISVSTSAPTVTAAVGISVQNSTVTGGISNASTIDAVVTAAGGGRATGIAVGANLTGGISNTSTISAMGPNPAVGISAGVGTVIGGINNMVGGMISAASTNSGATGVVVAGTTLTGAAAGVRNDGAISASAPVATAIGIAVTTGTIVSGGAGAAGISNTGTITAKGKTAIGIQLQANSKISGGITNTGTITAATAAIDLSQATVVTTINQQGGALNGNVNLSPNGDTFNFTGGMLNGTLADVSGKNTGTVLVSGTGTSTLSTTAKIVNVSSFTHSAGATLAFQVTPAQAPSVSAHTIALNGIFTVAPQGFSVGQTKTFLDVFLATGTLSKGTSFSIANPTGFTVILSADTANANALDLQVSDNAAVTPNTPNTSNTPNTPNTPNAPIRRVALAKTPNQIAVANALQALGSGGVFDAVKALTAADAPQALDALSGEVHASVVTAAYEDALLPQAAILDRLSEPLSTPLLGVASTMTSAYAADFPSQKPSLAPVALSLYQPRLFDLWGQGFGDWGRVARDGNAATLSRSIGGFVLGSDVSARSLLGGDWRLGLVGGYTNDSLAVNQRASSGTFESVFGGAYVGVSFGSVKLRAGALYGSNTTSIVRSATFPAFFEQLSSNNGGSTTQAFGEAGYRIELSGAGFGGGSRLSVEPFAGAAALLIHQNAFAEMGGTSALSASARDFNIQTTTLGLRGELAFASMPLTARTLLSWRHAYGDVVPSVLLSFQGGARAFSISGVPIDRDAFVAEAGIDYSLTSMLTVGISYAGQFGQRATDNALKGNVNLRF